MILLAFALRHGKPYKTVELGQLSQEDRFFFYGIYVCMHHVQNVVHCCENIKTKDFLDYF
jgi:hypothetical protein